MVDALTKFWHWFFIGETGSFAKSTIFTDSYCIKPIARSSRKPDVLRSYAESGNILLDTCSGEGKRTPDATPMYVR